MYQLSILDPKCETIKICRFSKPAFWIKLKEYYSILYFFTILLILKWYSAYEYLIKISLFISRSLERSTSKNGTSDSGLDSNYSYLSGSTPSRFSTSASSSTSVPSSNSYSSSSTSTSAPFGITRRDSSTSSYKR